jgi:hypothetical protein
MPEQQKSKGIGRFRRAMLIDRWRQPALKPGVSFDLQIEAARSTCDAFGSLDGQGTADPFGVADHFPEGMYMSMFSKGISHERC